MSELGDDQPIEACGRSAAYSGRNAAERPICTMFQSLLGRSLKAERSHKRTLALPTIAAISASSLSEPGATEVSGHDDTAAPAAGLPAAKMTGGKAPAVCLESRAWFALRRVKNSSTARGGVGIARAGDARRTAPASRRRPLEAAADCIIFTGTARLEHRHGESDRIATGRGARLLLAACAGQPTPYQAARGGFGYSEQQIEENHCRVSFAGNSATSWQTVEDYLLYRSAELTVQTDHDWFQVVDRNTVQEYSGYGGSPAFGLGVGSGSDVGVGLSVPMSGGGFRALQCGHGHPGAGRREAAGRPRCLRRLLGDQPAAAKGPRRRRLLRGRALPDPSGNAGGPDRHSAPDRLPPAKAAAATGMRIGSDQA
jgi:hypothetical protein